GMRACNEHNRTFALADAGRWAQGARAPDQPGMMKGVPSDGDQGATRRRRSIHWTEVTLHFADGSGLTSSWCVADASAAQTGARRMPGLAATAEHLRALRELRDEGGATNWFSNPELNPEGAPRAEDIDWAGFPISEEDS
ncbi:MAG: hypothetical protein JWN04_3425, partial [Myxococcaceae bacterium]|nr:hypothetical protein [Myxococcaceae bacterium]